MPWFDTPYLERTVLDLLQCLVSGTLGLNCHFNWRHIPGSFVSLYKYILNALPLLHQPPEPQSPFSDDEDEDVQLNTPRPANKRDRQLRLSVSGRAHQAWTEKRTKAWFSVVAGAIAGAAAITFEKRPRRIAIGQQMFVRSVGMTKISTTWCSLLKLRGLQGSYNALATKYGFTVPYGAVWLFSIACSQIMYGYLLRPDTLPKAYISWIDQAGQIPVNGIAINRDLVREGTFKISDIDQLLSNPVRPPRFTNTQNILILSPR